MSYQRAREHILQAVAEMGGIRRLTSFALAAAVAVGVVWWAGWVRGGTGGSEIPLDEAGGPAGAPADTAWDGTAPSGAAGAAVGGSAVSSDTLVVYVTGAVRRPGLVRLPAGSRVGDAVLAAGGFSRDADQASVNLAQHVADAQQVHVPKKGEAAAGVLPGAGPGGASGPLDLNTATLEQLDSLPGIGPVLAQRILDHRAQIGRFGSVDDLAQVDGIGPKRFNQLKELVTVR